MLLPCLTQPMLELMPSKERTREWSLLFLPSVPPYSSVNQKQRALVDYRVSRSEIETVELMFCNFQCSGKKEIRMHVQGTKYKLCNFGYSASELNPLIFAFQ